MITCLIPAFLSGCLGSGEGRSSATEASLAISGIYPHLAVYNDEDECGPGRSYPGLAVNG